HVLTHPKATVAEVLELLPGPDYPGPSQVINGNELADIYARGSGTIRVRGRWHVEDAARGAQVLVVDALPHNGSGLASITKFCTNIDDLVAAGELPGVIDCNDESADGETRIVVRVAAGVDPDQIAAALLRNTDLQVSNTVKMHFLDHRGRVRLFNILTLIRSWIDHRIVVITNRSVRRLEQIAARLDRLDGFAIVLLDIDEAIRIVRTSKTRAIALQGLVAHFGVTEFQADAVLDLALGRLTEDARLEYATEAEALRVEQASLQRLIESPKLLRKQVGQELGEAAKAFVGFERQTEITTVTAALPTTVVIDAPLEVAFTTSGYVQGFKEIGKGRDAKGHTVMHRVPMSTASTLLVLTDSGQLHRVLGNAIPTDKPTALQNVIQMDPAEQVLLFIDAPEQMDDLILVTSAGTIKRIAGADLAGGDRKGGISIIKLDAGEKLAAVFKAPAPGVPVAIVTAQGQVIRFVPDDVRPMGRSAAGVRGIKLAPKDVVVGAVPASDGKELTVFHAKGSAKRVDFDGIPVQGRGGKGLRVTVVGGRHGDVAAVCNGGAAEITGRSADGELLTVNRSSITLAARDAAPAKIRMFDGVIAAVVQLTPIVGGPAPDQPYIAAPVLPLDPGELAAASAATQQGELPI
ncbi:MAG TPA: DNA gyrase subunit A, partial [Ilumatobacteraceae bacterium]|nr:DNA gyrase subunit A [Ilumatobacteraceae bacterium]